MKAFNLQSALERPEEITELYLHYGRLQAIPKEVFQLRNLKQLTVSSNELSSISERIAELTKLEILSLPQNRIRQLPDYLALLPRLREIDLSNNPLETFPALLFQICDLHKLELRNCGIKNLPKEIAGLSALRELNVSNNALRRLPPEIGKLAALRILNIAGNQILRLPKAIGNSQDLERLDAADNLLRQLPDTIGRLTALRHLVLNGNRLKKLPSALGNCISLRTLEAGSNNFRQIPPSCGRLKWMVTFRIDHNKIHTVPDELARCRQLRTLNLSFNALQKLPAWIAEAPGLHSLDLNGNQMDTWPQLSPKITRLSIAGNRLRRIGDEIGRLERLQFLDISNNLIGGLPDSLKHCRQLKSLQAGGNPIEGFPETLVFLEQLKELKGIVYYERKKQLFRFLNACREIDIDPVNRLPYFNILSGHQKVIPNLDWRGLVNALHFPMPEVENAGRRFYFENKSLPLAAHPITAGVQIAILGEHWFENELLNHKLSTHGIRRSHRIEAGVTHVLLGRRPGMPGREPAQQLVFLIEKNLSDYFYQVEGSYLAGEEYHEKIPRLRQLLHHAEEENVELAIRLLQGGGVPDALLTDLLIAWKHARNYRINRELRRLLELHISEAAKQALRQPLGLRGRLSEETLSTNIWKLTHGNEFDGHKIARFLVKRYGKGRKYLEIHGR